jgi:predicted dehydrogenase
MFAAQVERFVETVLDDRPPTCNARCGLAGMVLLEAIYRSAATGEAVTLAV